LGLFAEDDAETILIMVAAGTGIGILPDYDIHHPQVNLNLIYIPLETYGYNETLQVIYSRTNNNPLIPLFMEEV
jgi:LysR family transcriptional activator of glutamate synthase operon